MKICYTQDEALLRRFYKTMYPRLPLYQNRRKKLLTVLGVIALILLAAYLVSKFVLFLIGAAAVAFLLLKNARVGVDERTVGKIVEFNKNEYGADAIDIVIECKKDKIAASRAASDAEDYIEYGALTDILYDGELFCMATNNNAHYFPIGAIPEGRDALVRLLKEKNPAVRVSEL